MTSDLYAGAAFSLLATAAVFATGRRLSAAASPRAVLALSLAALASLLLFLLFGQERLFWARWFPHTGGVLFGNPALPLTGLLAGCIARFLSGSAFRRALFTVPLLLAGGFLTFRPLVGSMPPTSDTWWPHGVCRQTSAVSCSAASAATLLRAHGIATTEPEMATLCLTRDSGTPMLGVYRGLRLKTRGTQWRVEVLTGRDVETLRRAVKGGPVLLSVGLNRWARGIDPRYAAEWGWTPGLRHAVVLFGFGSDGRPDIGDPSAGRENWNVEALSVLWHGEGIRLVPGQRYH